MSKRYPDFVKQSILKQILNSSCSISEIAKNNNIPYSTVSTWKSNLLHKGKNMKHKFSPEEKLEMLFATASMSEAEVSEFCRNKGIYPHTLKTWKEECIKGFSSNSKKSSYKKKKALISEIKALKKEIRRKDRALAETTALLVLKKKAEQLWGETEDDL